MKLKSILTQLSTVALLLMSACMQEKGKIALKYSEQNTYTPPVLLVTLTNTPANPSSNYYPLNVSVGGSLVAQYSYAIISGSQICALAAYSSFFATSVPITDPVSEGERKLCVKGRSSDGVVQANATEHAWYQDNTAPSFSLFQLRDVSDGSATATDSFTVNAVGASAGTPTPLSYCFKSSSSTPIAGDGCWSSSATQSIVIAGSTSTIYAWVRDSVLNTSSSSFDSISVNYPLVSLTNAPSNPSSSTPMNVTVGGSYVGSYDYVITNQSTSCSAVSFPGSWTSALTPITAVPTDGLNRLCVLGRTSGGVEATSSYVHDWLQDSTGPTVLSFILRDQTDNSSTGTDSYTVNGIFSATGTPSPLEYCVSTTASTPTPTDGCWTSSTSSSVVIGFSTTTIYGWARDAYQNVSASSSDTITILYPQISLTNAPSSPSTSTPLNVTVGGQYAATYDYALTDQTIDCSSVSFIGPWLSTTSTAITNAPSDGNKRLCVITRTAGGVNSTYTYVHDWVQDSTAPTITLFELRDQSDNSTTLTDSTTVNAVMSATGTPMPLSYCFSTSSATPSAGCWSSSSTQAATIVSSATIIYGWVRDAYGNMASSSDSIPYSNLCDSGTLATTCYVTSTKTLLNGELVQGAGNLVVDAGGSITATATAMISINMGGNITLQNGGVIAANLTATSTNFTIDATSSINVNGRGYLGGQLGSVHGINGQGSGGGFGHANVGGGAGHGGAGGFGHITVGGAGGGSYDATTTPVLFGSGGGGTSGHAMGRGGNGGGAIRLNILGIFSTSGTISANGEQGYIYGPVQLGGGGAGGSIWISAASLAAATGTITANGAAGIGASYFGGAGGGGRIALNLPTPFKGTVRVDGGARSYPDPTYTPDGRRGSIYVTYGNICSTGTIATTCTISDLVYLHDDYVINTTGDFIIDSGGKLQTFYNTDDDIDLITTGNLTVQNGGQFLADVVNLTVNNLNMPSNGIINTRTLNLTAADVLLTSSSTIKSNVLMTATNLTLDLTSSINANGKGYLGGELNSVQGNAGQGTGGGGVNAVGGGGGYGGAGGFSHTGVGAPGGGSYGSTTTPNAWGSGGGGSSTYSDGKGGNGGGSVKLTISGTLSTSGTISANGDQGTISTINNTRVGGGGSGGSIWIIASNLSSATGTLSAKGADGTTGAWASGAGGGGRIALDLPTPFRGQLNVSGGAKAWPDPAITPNGLKGSIYLTYGNICSSGSLTTTCTITDVLSLHDDYVINTTGHFIIDSGGKLQTYYNDQDDLNITTTGDMTIQNGGQLSADVVNLSVNNLNLPSNGIINTRTLTLAAADVLVTSSSTIKSNVDIVATNLTLDLNSSINASGKGYLGGELNSDHGNAGQGPGGGGIQAVGGGAGYGGAGGFGHLTVGGTGGGSYGSTTTPNAWGSGGGGSSTYADGRGGNGGGSVKLNLSGILSTSGTISANGDKGTISTLNNTRVGGGGAGGSIWIIASGLSSATGTLSAKGADGTAGAWFSGAGGGGRIALDLPSPFRGYVFVDGGARSYYDVTVTPDGRRGSIYTTYTNICSSGTITTTCNITDNVSLHDGYTINTTGHFVIDSGGKLQTYYPDKDDLNITTTGNLTLQNGGLISGDILTVAVNNLNLSNGSSISGKTLSLTNTNTTLSANSTITANVTLTGTNFTMDQTSSLNANGKGYLGGELNSDQGVNGQGTGGGTTSYYVGAGGGHGGYGGAGTATVTGVGGITYGSTSTPSLWGSGGAGSTASYIGKGGNGGGLVRLNLSGTFSSSGTISANGSQGVAYNLYYIGGGGSGGSVWISASSVASATGSILAKGADGSVSTYTSGAGGGGRVALDLPSPFYGTINVSRGSTPYIYSVSSTPSDGSFYTDYDNICNSGSHSTPCTISSRIPLGVNASINMTDDITLDGGSLYTVRNGDYISVSTTGDITLQNNASIYANLSPLYATNITVNSGSSISASGKGHLGGLVSVLGLGTGAGSMGNGGGGAGHAGAGGAGNTGVSGSIYGSTTTPITFGSGGGSAHQGDTYGGDGGGALKIIATDTLTINGNISAEGNAGGQYTTSYGGGGGAGGSIWISADTIDGTLGTVSVKGGSATSTVTYRGGGGGGGYIFMTHTNADNFTGVGTSTAAGGIGYNNGAAGKIVAIQDCPTGYVWVQGNSTLVTSGFCVMQYEAKNDGGGNAISQAAGAPWVNISGSSSFTTCDDLNSETLRANIDSDTNNDGTYALISNREWMTIARDAERTHYNWSGAGGPGDGTMPRGWSANSGLGDAWTNTAVASSAGPACLYNTGVNSCASTGTFLYRRTHRLYNGNEIWDLAGNAFEWANWSIGGSFTLGPTTCTAAWTQFPSVSCGALTYNDYGPLNTSLNSTQGVGQFYGGTLGGLIRGVSFDGGTFAGIYAMWLGSNAGYSAAHVGFRCVYRPH